MTNIVLCGQGAMGKVIEQEAQTYDGIHLAGFVSPRNGQYGEAFGKVDVVIDFSNPANLDFLIDYAARKNAALLICTTGYSEAEKEKIREAGRRIPVILSSNTSVGINVVRKMLKLIVNELNSFDIDIIERHHNKKKDSPSGTAKTLAEDIMKATGRDHVETHAMRAGTIPGEHTVIFSGNDEMIEIKHTAFSKKIFARGALEIALKLSRRPAGYYETEDMFEVDNMDSGRIINIA
ncbi:MAG: dihydrodipicolinate reductase C-terminal domain-containing protein [Sedimentibacter sp.]|uniref:4-hydroxy-tetrahydrodipicolinate reductase n=1 Tax=Sedimentibacter sp. TaxID=1960295 RepID=UPI003159356F